jgi:hypothetical protein
MQDHRPLAQPSNSFIQRFFQPNRGASVSESESALEESSSSPEEEVSQSDMEEDAARSP